MLKESTIRYVIRNFFYLALFALIPAVLFTMFLTPVSQIQLLRNLRNGAVIENWFEDAYVYLSFINFNRIWMWLLSFLVLTVTSGITIAATEQHMALGVRRKNVFRLLNDSILLILPYVLFCLVLYEVLAMTFSGLIVLASMLFSGTVLFVITLLLLIALGALTVVCAAYSICTVPCMLEEGYSFGTAVGYSISLVSGHLWKTCISLFICYLCTFAVEAVTVFFAEKAFYAVRFCALLFWFVYLPAFSVRKYFELTGSERKDLEPAAPWGRKA